MVSRRKLPDGGWLETIAELLINMAAGWFGAILIVPNFTGSDFPYNVFLLIGDLVGGIISLALAVKLKRLAKLRKKR